MEEQEDKVIGRAKKLVWKNIGTGTFKFQGKYIYPGQEFEALDKDVPKGARDIIVRIEGVTEQMKKDIPNQAEPYMMRMAGAWYNVYDKLGNQINEKGVRKSDAEKILAKLKK